MNRRKMLHMIAQAGAAVLIPALARAEDWPRRITGAGGRAVELAAPPRRILSTSVTLTGTALAIGAPVIASAATVKGDFFSQWRAEAEARGVEKLWPAGRVDLEAVLELAPDLILVSANGADSALQSLDQLAAIAPVLVMDYASQPWEAVAMELAKTIGTEATTRELLTRNDAWIAGQGAGMTRPPGQVNIVSYNGPGMPNPVGIARGPHGRLLAQLGFQVEPPPASWGPPQGDFVRVAYEYLPDLTAATTFLVAAEDDRASAFLADPLLANLPSVRAGRVYALGETSFRIDYYSAREIVTRLAARFAG